MNSPIAIARAAVKGVLSDPANGLNPALVAACIQYGVAPALEIDFTTVNQFIEAQTTYGDTEDSGNPQSILMALYGAGAVVFPKDSGKWLFSYQWCGTVSLIADAWLCIEKEAVDNFEYSADAFEAAMLGTMNAAVNNAALTKQGLLYDQEISCIRQRPAIDGDNWIIPMRFPMSFEVYL